jgi:hypothetical protein
MARDLAEFVEPRVRELRFKIAELVLPWVTQDLKVKPAFLSDRRRRMRAAEQCARCGRVIDTELNDGRACKAIDLDDGTVVAVCEDCVTVVEEYPTDADTAETVADVVAAYDQEEAAEE